MGMAASQARYLALTARKSNCEYEGQQINQSRLTLSNKSSALFNQMLGLTVPVPPSQQDYTSIQYSWSDGTTDYAITDWKKLSSLENSDYNYVVSYYYETTEPQGSQKYMTNPQVQFSGTGPVSTTDYSAQVAKIEEAQRALASAKKEYETAQADYNSLVKQFSSLSAYQDNTILTSLSTTATKYLDKDGNELTGDDIKDEDVTQCKFVSTNPIVNSDGYTQYTYTTTDASGATTTETRYGKDGTYYTYINGQYSSEGVDQTAANYTQTPTEITYTRYGSLGADTQGDIDKAIKTLKDYGALDDNFKASDVFYNEDNGTMTFLSDIANVMATKTTLVPAYHLSSSEEGKTGIAETQTKINEAMSAMNTAKGVYDLAQKTVDTLDVPTYRGNYKLTPISELTESQETAINQIIKDMQDAGISTNLTRCFNTLSGVYDADTYLGGIYSYTVNDATYYATYYDLADSYMSGESTNKTENQTKLPVYTAGDVKVRKENSQKALLETDTSGRFTTVRFEDDSIVYTLNAEEKQDTAGYDDAMNQYNYNKSLYDKKVQEINAQTSIIQQEDQNLELRLKQLDTEQNALSTEIDAVSKVVKDNVEKSFKTFSG